MTIGVSNVHIWRTFPVAYLPINASPAKNNLVCEKAFVDIWNTFIVGFVSQVMKL